MWGELKRLGVCRKLVILVPSRNLRDQWQRVAQRFGVRLSNGNAYELGDPSTDGVVLTYAAICSSPDTLRAVCKEYGLSESELFLICDEYHRVSESKTTGERLLQSFPEVGKRLLLSGTFYRTDRRSMPWVNYESDGMPITDYEYIMSEAISDGVLRAPEFMYFDGEAKFVTIGSTLDEKSKSYSELSNLSDESKVIRSLVNDRSNLFAYLVRGVDQLRLCQRVNPRDKGGIVVSCVEDAYLVQGCLRELGVTSTVVVSPGETDSAGVSIDSRENESSKTDNSELLNSFREGHGGDWVISVAMLREGTDIPDWRVLLYLTTCRSRLSFSQLIPRAMRIRCNCTGPRHDSPTCDHVTGANVTYILLPQTPSFLALALDVLDSVKIAQEAPRPPRDPVDGEEDVERLASSRRLESSVSETVFSAGPGQITVTKTEVLTVINYADSLNASDPSKGLGDILRGKLTNEQILAIAKHSGIVVPSSPVPPPPVDVPPLTPEAEKSAANKEFQRIVYRLASHLCARAGLVQGSPAYDSAHENHLRQVTVVIQGRVGVRGKWNGKKLPASASVKRAEAARAYECEIMSGKVSA
jgi:superfamily II DNA or RNA helicase